MKRIRNTRLLTGFGAARGLQRNTLVKLQPVLPLHLRLLTTTPGGNLSFCYRLPLCPPRALVSLPRFLHACLAHRLLPALCVLLLVSGCLCGGEGVNEGDVNLISMEEEWQLGQRLAQRIEQQMPMVEGPVRQYVQQMGEEIVAQTDFADRPWTFHVVASDEVNAFALPGGHVYVNTGLIETAATPSELAGVLAHEVAHGTARHGTERLTKVYGLNAVLGLITGEESGLIEQILTRLGQRGTIAKFSRDDEREADQLGLGYLAETGYDPRGMVRFFDTLLEERRSRPNALEQFFASHPLTEERLDAARQQIEQLPASADGGKGPAPEANLQRFRRVQQRLQQRTRP